MQSGLIEITNMSHSNGPHRINYNDQGHAHELTFSCYRGFQFLRSERTCHWLAESLFYTRKQFDIDLWAYVFMPEHVHLIIHPRKAKYDIAAIRQSIKEPVGRKAIAFLKADESKWLQRITVRKNSRVRRFFWQRGGGYDRNIIELPTLLKMIDYIHNNPVRRELVEQAHQWKWSSADWFLERNCSPVEMDSIPPEWIMMK